MGHAGDDDDPGAEPGVCRLLDERHEELCEEEVSEVVGAQLHVEPVLRLPVGARHHARVVDLALWVVQRCREISQRLRPT